MLQELHTEDRHLDSYRHWSHVPRCPDVASDGDSARRVQNIQHTISCHFYRMPVPLCCIMPSNFILFSLSFCSLVLLEARAFDTGGVK